MRQLFWGIQSVLIFALSVFFSLTAIAQDTGIVIYGATPGGIAAALAAGAGGHEVLLVEPTSRIGGMASPVESG